MAEFKEQQDKVRETYHRTQSFSAKLFAIIGPQWLPFLRQAVAEFKEQQGRVGEVYYRIRTGSTQLIEESSHRFLKNFFWR